MYIISMKTKIKLTKENFNIERGRIDKENSFQTFFKNIVYTVEYINIDRHFIKSNYEYIISFIEKNYNDLFSSTKSNLKKSESEYIRDVLKINTTDYNAYQNVRGRIIRKREIMKRDNYFLKKENIIINKTNRNNITLEFVNINKLPVVLYYDEFDRIEIEQIYEIIEKIININNHQLDKLLSKNEFIEILKKEIKLYF